MPVLVVWGSDDAIMPLSIGERLASTLPNVRYEVIAECGHLPVLEQPHLASAVADFTKDRVEKRYELLREVSVVGVLHRVPISPLGSCVTGHRM